MQVVAKQVFIDRFFEFEKVLWALQTRQLESSKTKTEASIPQ